MIMLMHQWKSGPFPEATARAIVGDLWDKISFKFVSTDAGYVNPRMDEEALHKKEISEKCRESVRIRYGRSTDVVRTKEKMEKTATSVVRSDYDSDSDSCSDSDSSSASSLTEGVQGEEWGDAEKTFEEARKLFPGTKRGHNTEWTTFKKHRDYQSVVGLLVPAIKRETDTKSALRSSRTFCPEWAHFQTWINQRRWESEFEKSQNRIDAQAAATERYLEAMQNGRA